MAEHLEIGDIEQYGQRQLSADRMALAIVHLAGCQQCMKEYKSMFPEATSINQGFPLPLEAESEVEEFHLDFEEHLRRYVDDDIDEPDREIVEGHVKTCVHCAGLLRDLQEFRERIDNRLPAGTERKHGFMHRLYAAVSHRPFALAFVLLLVIGVGAALSYLSGRADNSAESAVSDVTVSPPNSQPAIDRDADVTTESVTPAIHPTPTEPEIVRLKLPGFNGNLRLDPPGTLRGGRESRPIVVLSANGVVFRDEPTLKWAKAEGVDAYEVSIYDADDNRITGAQSVGATSWRAGNLARGRIYKWQVTAERLEPGGTSTGYMGQGRFYLLSEAEEARIAKAGDPLEKGRALAEAGLIREAALEFRKIPASDARSTAARAYLRQLGFSK